MKLSLRIQDDQESSLNPLVRAKIPVTIFNQPFTSSIATVPSSSSRLSFSLSSAFSAGPSLRLTYSHADPSPFSLSLKSGLGLLGSPEHSPLVFKAHFSLSRSNPTFFLHVKPQLGNFSLKKTTVSDPVDSSISGSCSNGGLDNGSGLDGGFVNGSSASASNGWHELSLEPSGGKDVNGGGGFVEERQLGLKNGTKDGVLSGIAVMARTVLPVMKGVRVNMRWGVNFPAKLRSKMPYLTVNKIAIEMVNEVKGEQEEKSGVGELEVLKGMCFSMRRYLEVLEKENREIKQSLEDMKSGVLGRQFNGERDVARRRVVPQLGEGSSEFERWRNKKSGRDENVRAGAQLPVKSVKEVSSRVEAKKCADQTPDLESELERAIKAATA